MRTAHVADLPTVPGVDEASKRSITVAQLVEGPDPPQALNDDTMKPLATSI